jgi:virginiamycin B lyase
LNARLSRFPRIALLVLLLACGTLASAKSSSAFQKQGARSQPQYIDEYEVPKANSGPFAITVDRNGTVWFSEDWFIQPNATKIAEFFPTNKSLVEYPVPDGGDIWGITTDNRSNVWFTQYIQREFVNASGVLVYEGRGRLGRFNILTRNFTFVDVPTDSSFPMRLTLDDRGRVWFTEFYGNKIGVFDPTSQKLTEYAVPTQSSGPTGITLDTSGSVWFTEADVQKIGIFFPTNSSFLEYSLGSGVYSPVALLVHDGFVWFADHGGNWIGKFDPRTETLVKYPTHFPPENVASLSVPNDILRDAKGRIWFTEHGGNSVGFFDPSAQVMVEFPIPTGPISTTHWFALAPDGNIWFAEWSGNKIGVINSDTMVPASVSVNENRLTLPEGGQMDVSMHIVSPDQAELNLTYVNSWSTRERNEVSVRFAPEPANSTSATVQATVNIPVATLAGEYVMGIGVDAGSFIVWRFIDVIVNSSSFIGPLGNSSQLLILILVAVIAVAVFLLAFRVLRTKRATRAHMPA